MTKTFAADKIAAEAAAQTYRETWASTLRLAHLLTDSPAEAEDVAQEAYLGLLRAGPVLNPTGYVRRSVVNIAINTNRKRSRNRLTAVPPDRPGTEQPTDDLWPLVRLLPPRQRAVVVLRYYLDLSEADIATALGCRPGTVKAHASKALAHLRKEMP